MVATPDRMPYQELWGSQVAGEPVRAVAATPPLAAVRTHTSEARPWLRELRSISLLHIFACHVGHYPGHNDVKDMTVIDQVDWPRAT